jgi:succinate dehydrogenase / fumarate reductase cytochrome b subunit
MQTDNRPISPHLQIYRLPFNAVLSISHRLTGIALSLGSLVLVAWLVAAAAGPQAYAVTGAVLGSIPVQMLMFAWTFALFYHLCNGVRHLFWDAGYGFDLTVTRRTGLAALVAAAALTVAAWIIAFAS